ncbi:hypothetical protein ETB97_005200 [Aspergillus alliaceus]|uniref:Major facilitator superfamily (MFS) profile domain-containing protein n=1 Tax=Petromyces alliaceus TaxID=209559 RepID=A0A8H5ZZE7_PETAA|nr:hypothetical protein ETB97_005200 [Aspergillus burnettii]
MDAPISEHSLHDQELEQIQWNNPREKLNPRSWPVWKKLFHAVVPCIVAFVITFGTSVNDAAVELLARNIRAAVDRTTIRDCRPPLDLCYPPSLLLAFSAGARAASNLATLLICRELAGFFGSAQVALGAGTLADIWHLEKEGSPSSLFSILGMFLGPTVGSVAGAYALQDHHCERRFTQWVMVILCAPVCLGSVSYVEEGEVHGGTARHYWTWNACKDVAHRGHCSLVDPVYCFPYAMIFSYFASSSVIVGHLLAAFMFGVFNKSLYANAREAGGGIAAPETFVSTQRWQAALI